jgi:hypothetical protein
MKCPVCGQENPDDSQFCSKCGMDLRIEDKKDTPTGISSTPLLKSNLKRPIRGWMWLMGSVGILLVIIGGVVIVKRVTTNPNEAWERWEANSINLITPDYNALISYQPWDLSPYQEGINNAALYLQTDVNKCETSGKNLTASPEMQPELEWFKDGLLYLGEGAGYLTADNSESGTPLSFSNAISCFEQANAFFNKAGLTLNSSN